MLKVTCNLGGRYVLILSCGAAVLTVGRAVRWNDVLSYALNQFSVSYGYRPETLRSRFGDDEMVEVKPAISHTHGVSAANRSTGSLFIEQFAKGLARKVWFFQCSRSDQRTHRLGSRQYFWAKDLTAAPAVFKPEGGDLLAMVDVDQYVDIPNFCVDHFRPLLLYTFQPFHVAKSEGEYTYTFNKKNEVTYKVSGGAEYNHQVWNYSSDSLKFSRTIFGIPYLTVTYLVDKRGVDEDHQLILLTPLRKWRGLMAILARFLSGPHLSRFTPVQGDFLRMEKHAAAGVVVCTGRVNEYVSCEIPANVDSYLSSISRTSKVGLTLPQVKSRVEHDLDGSAVLYEYYLSELPRSWPSVFPVGRYVRNYQFHTNEYDPEAKRSMTAFMQPIVDGAFCPDVCTGNDRQAISGRILKVRNSTQLDRFLIRCVDEFVTLFLGKKEGKLVPFDPQDVYERQKRPTQQRILKEAEFSLPRRLLKNFMKKEAYLKPADPRIISQINGPDKYVYSQFLYSFNEVLKDQEWYAFGKTPFEISVRVVEILRRAKCAGNTDFSRMDGRVSEVLRYLEKQMTLRAFQPQYSEHLVDLMRSQHSLRGFMTHGKSEPIVFEQGLARASGSPETSAFNTVDNAFVAFLGLRMSRELDGSYIQPIEAYSRLGVYGGDDGVTADLDPKIYCRAAERCGQLLEIEMISRGNRGIQFLSRAYGPDVWFGDVTSCCDIKRALSKFHVTANMPPHIGPLDKLMDKSFAYWLTDQNTPIIGAFVSKVMEFRPTNYEFKNVCMTWNARYPKTVQYPNDPRDWYVDYVNDQLPEFDHETFTDWLAKAGTVTDLLSPPQCFPTVQPEVKRPTVVDGDVVIPPSTKQDKSKSPASGSLRKSSVSTTSSEKMKRRARPRDRKKK